MSTFELERALDAFLRSSTWGAIYSALAERLEDAAEKGLALGASDQHRQEQAGRRAGLLEAMNEPMLLLERLRNQSGEDIR